MLVESPGLRAMLYSFPIPITIALVAGSTSEAGGQYVGVVLLVAFMYAVALLEPRAGRLVSVVCALMAYLAIAAAVHNAATVPSVIAFGASALCLGAIELYSRLRPPKAQAATQVRPGLLEYAAVPVVTAATWLLGTALGPFVVTFPYSGVPTALAIRSGQFAFASNFAKRAWLLLGFLGLFHVVRMHFSMWESLGLAWFAFLFAAVWANRRDLVAQIRSHLSS